MKMYSEVIKITPAKAAIMLRHGAKNRNIRPRVVGRYAADMEAGLWKLTPQGISFDTSGNLIDGQHRLSAIVKCGVPQQLNVSYNVPPESMIVMDSGASRRPADSIAIGSDDDWINSHVIATARALEFGYSDIAERKNQSNQAVHNLCLKHKDALLFVEEYLPRGKKAPAAVKAAIARAYYHYASKPDKLARLREFAYVVATADFTSKEDNAALRLRDLIQRALKGNRLDSFDMFLKAQSAIKNFMARTIIKNVVGCSPETEAYPLKAAA